MSRLFPLILAVLVLLAIALPLLPGVPDQDSALPAALPDPGKTLRPLPEFLLVMRTATYSSNPTPGSELYRLQNLSERKVLGINRHSDFTGSIRRDYQTGRIGFDISKIPPPRFTPAQVEAARKSPEADTAIFNEAIQKKLGAVTRDRWVYHRLPFVAGTTTLKVNGHLVIRVEFRPHKDGSYDVIESRYVIPALNYIEAGTCRLHFKDGVLESSHDEFPEILRIGESVPDIFFPAPKEPNPEAYKQLVKDGWLPDLLAGPAAAPAR